MDPEKTAVVLIEYQNDFTSPGGTLHEAVKPVMEATQMMRNTKETVEKARDLGATIVHAPITFTEDYRELTSEPYGILKGVVDTKSFRKGTWGAEDRRRSRARARPISLWKASVDSTHLQAPTSTSFYAAVGLRRSHSAVS